MEKCDDAKVRRPAFLFVIIRFAMYRFLYNLLLQEGVSEKLFGMFCEVRFLNRWERFLLCTCLSLHVVNAARQAGFL